MKRIPSVRNSVDNKYGGYMGECAQFFRRYELPDVECSAEINMMQGTVLTLSEPRPTTCRLAQYAGARAANNDGLRMREDGGNAKAPCDDPAMYQHPDRAGVRFHAPGHLTSMK
jgi:hypothetical protein